MATAIGMSLAKSTRYVRRWIFVITGFPYLALPRCDRHRTGSSGRRWMKPSDTLITMSRPNTPAQPEATASDAQAGDARRRRRTASSRGLLRLGRRVAQAAESRRGARRCPTARRCAEAGNGAAERCAVPRRAQADRRPTEGRGTVVFGLMPRKPTPVPPGRWRAPWCGAPSTFARRALPRSRRCGRRGRISSCTAGQLVTAFRRSP